MKNLLMNRKKAFMIYLIACLFPIVNQLLTNYALSALVGSASAGSLDAFWKAFLMACSIVIATGLIFITSRMMRIGFIRDIILDVRVLAFDKIQRLSYEAFSSKSRAVYMSNLINDINLFEENFFLKLINVIFRAGAYVVSIAILAFMDLPFALAILVISISLFFCVKTFESKTTKMQEAVSEANEGLTVDFSNTFDGMELLKLNNVEAPFLKKSIEAMDRVEKNKLNYNVFTEAQRNLTRMISSLVFVGILLYMLWRLNNGLDLTTMTFMIVISNSCIWPLEQIIPMYNELIASMRIFEKITNIDDSDLQELKGTLPYHFSKEIEVKNLTFSYESRTILNNISFKIEKGKKYLLKGASGSGKSTLIKLLSQTYSDYDGHLLYDGVALKEIEPLAYNKHVSFIYQDVFLFEDSLLNNITLYRPTSTHALDKAVEQSGLTEFVDLDSSGLERVLKENGSDLSGGQRQRIAIARALVKDVDIIFADEATSSLNPDLGRKIEQTLLNLPCTVIAVSHRYYEGITENYDAVLEIKNGKVSCYDAQTYFEKSEVQTA